MTPGTHRRPLARLAGTLARLPKYLNLAQRLIRDPNLSSGRKAALGFGIGYVAMPLDLIPGIIPVLGQLDDLAALLFGLRTALRGFSPEAAHEHLSQTGLSESALDADIRTVQVTAVWVVAGAASLAARGISASFRALQRFRNRPAPGTTSDT